MAAGDVLTDLIFLKPDSKYMHEKPYRLRYDPGDAIPRTNCETDVQRDITIRDIRGKEADYTLNRNGFQVVRLDSKLTPEDFHDRAKVKAVYYQELKELLKRTLGAKKVEVLEHGVCSSLVVVYSKLEMKLVLRLTWHVIDSETTRRISGFDWKGL
jgi:hypothetical protein